eukprot:GILK01010587.1.p1 GENE.GILK01010587.1~~GILK01010587.1.p1  ORF type:complete len:564 (-),score=54.98 GILK01010587.1:45-1736(-)
MWRLCRPPSHYNNRFVYASQFRSLSTHESPSKPRRFVRVLAAGGCVLLGSGAYIAATSDLKTPQLVKITERMGRNAWGVVSSVVDYKYTYWKMKNMTPEEQEQAMRNVHLRGAHRLLHACTSNGGMYVKIGQVLAQMEHLLPSEYVQTMKSMFQSCPHTSYDDVLEVLQEELKTDPFAVFASLSPEPIASASLAQVHVGYLRDPQTGGRGPKVAVKVQHRGLIETSLLDIRSLDFFVRQIKRVFKDFQYGWFVDEVKVNLPNELDFRLEGLNAEKCAANFKNNPQVKVPRIYWPFTSQRVLVMEFEEGCSVTDVNELKRMKLDLQDVARLMSQTFSEQMFVHGFVHADPHPGNVLIRRMPNSSKPLLVMLDHGLYRTLGAEFKFNYCQLWRSLIMGDAVGIKEAALKLNAGELYPYFAAMLTYKSWDDIVASDRSKLQRKLTKEESTRLQQYAVQYAGEIGDVLHRVPREMLLLFKTNDCLRYVDRQLGAPINSYLVMSEYCLRGIRQYHRQTNPGVWSAIQDFQEQLHLALRVKMFKIYVWLLSWLNYATIFPATEPTTSER